MMKFLKKIIKKTLLYKLISKYGYRSKVLEKKYTLDVQYTKLYHNEYDVIMQVDSFLSGGLENVVIDLSSFLKQKGFRVIILVLGEIGDAGARARESGVDIYQMHFEYIQYKKFIQDNNVKIVITHYSINGLSICNEVGIPVLQVIHNVYMWFNDAQKQEFVRSIDYTKIFIAVSDYARDYSIKRLSVPPAKCYSIPNGVDLLRFRKLNNQSQIEKIKNELKILDSDFIFLCVGSINHQKNQLSLIKSFKIVVDSCPNAKLILIGPIYEYSLYNEIMKFTKNNKLDDKVIYYGKSNEPELFYDIAHVSVSSAFFEGGQLTFVEALIKNLPIVSTGIGFMAHEFNINGVYSVKNHVDIISFKSGILDLKSSFESEDQLAEKMISIYTNYERPNIPSEIINLMDKQSAYETYENVINKLIMKQDVSCTDFENTWFKKIERL